MPPFRNLSPRIFAATWGPNAERIHWDRLTRLLDGWTSFSGEGWLLAAEDRSYISGRGKVAAATTATRLFRRDDARMVSLADLVVAFDREGASAAGRLGTPYRLLWVDKPSGTVHAVSDRAGLGHLFRAQLGSFDLYSSSSTLLAQIVGAAPDREALAGFCQYGAFSFGETPFDSVSKLLAPDTYSSRSGRRAQHSRGHVSGGDLSAVFRDAVSAMANAAPDATLELSGGLDSRLVLAGLTPEQRRGRLALTLDDRGGNSADVRIACQLARAEHLDWKVHALPVHTMDDPDAFFALLRCALEAYDGMSNPIDKVPLVLEHADSPNEARFGGQNGEIIRGFYYPLQPLNRRPSSELVSRLLDWRIGSNDRVRSEYLSDRMTTEFIPAAKSSLQNTILRFQGNWGQAMDQIYLRYRMQSWVGNAVSNRLLQRVVLWPFFDDAFLSSAMALDPTEKKNSKAAYRMLCELDPALARVPLDSGLTPSDYGVNGWVAYAKRMRRTVSKGIGKAMQRLVPQSRNVLGSDGVVQAWARHGGHRRLDVSRLERLGLFHESALERMAVGGLKVDRASLGFLLMCDRVARIVEG